MLLKQIEDPTAPQLLKVRTRPDYQEKNHGRYRFVEYRSRSRFLIARILVHENLEIGKSSEVIEGRILRGILEVIVSHFKSSLKAP